MENTPATRSPQTDPDHAQAIKLGHHFFRAYLCLGALERAIKENPDNGGLLQDLLFIIVSPQIEMLNERKWIESLADEDTPYKAVCEEKAREVRSFVDDCFNKRMAVVEEALLASSWYVPKRSPFL